MKIVAQREPLFAAFQTAALFVPGRSPKEVLKSVKLEAAAGKVEFIATDMEVGVRVKVEGVEVDAPGSVLLTAGQFGAILRESSDEKIRIEATSRGLIVKGDRSEFKLPSADPDEFPPLAEFTEDKYHTVAAPLFRQIISRTEFSTDTESSRYALGGVLFEMDDQQIIGVGTDGRRLARMQGPAKSVGGHTTGDTMTIVRTDALRRVVRAITDSDGEVKLHVRASDILMQTPRATFYSRLVEGRFPRWRDVFPARRDAVQIALTVGPFFTTLRQAAVMTDNESRGIDFTFGEGVLKLNASTANVGQAQVELPIAYDGPSIVVTLDHRFVENFLRVLSPEQSLTLEIENNETAAVFWTEDRNYGYVVMPLARDR